MPYRADRHTKLKAWNFAVPLQVNYKVQDNKTKIASEDTISLQVFKRPFATGGCRLAYYAQDNMGTK